MQEEVMFSNSRGIYIPTRGLSESQKLDNALVMGSYNADKLGRINHGNKNFPYKFEQEYEAVNVFSLFRGKQEVVDEIKFKHANLLKYTFGLEFETSMGFVPEDLAFRDGLIPLRDGSIGGIEYSTVVLSGNTGLNLLKQQVDTLKKYTVFNKECSLHIHLGNFPLRPGRVFNVYKLCRNLQPQIQSLVPRDTFNSSRYKQSAKDYCNLLPEFSNFDDLYYGLVGTDWHGSFKEPHPADPGRRSKWNINQRYFWVNFINLICYDVNKTIEFRLLRPTWSFEKICAWLYTFNAILAYAELIEDPEAISETISLGKIFDSVYPSEFATQMKSEIRKIQIVTENQTRNGDTCGRDIVFDDLVFKDEVLL